MVPPLTKGRKKATRLVGLFQPKPVLPAGQCDDVAGRVVIVGGLPRGLSPVVKRGRGTADHVIQRLFLGQRQRMPSRPDMDPQQVGQARRTACAVDALLGIRGQRGFSLLRITLRRPGPVDHNSQEHKARGYQDDRQDPGSEG